jgi:pimeloyl-ACP methyl ester carboxylesterase
LSARPFLSQARDAFLHRPDASLHFRDEGVGRELVFVHGWAMSLEAWDPAARHFARTHRVVRSDRRGFGASPGPASLAADVLDVIALLDHLDIESAVLVGSSQGARVVLAAALHAAERVDALVLDGVPADPQFVAGNWRVDVPRDRYRRTFVEQGIEAVRRELADSELFASHADDRRVRDTIVALLDRYCGRDLVDPGPRIVGTTPERIAALAVPVLVLTGEHDPRRGFGDALCAAIHGAERAIIPASGHLPSLDNPQAYNATLEQFLETTATTRPRRSVTP